jgi:hypothetical protein
MPNRKKTEKVIRLTEIDEQDVETIASNYNMGRWATAEKAGLYALLAAGAAAAVLGIMKDLLPLAILGMSAAFSPVLLSYFIIQQPARRAFVDHWKETGELYGEDWWYNRKTRVYEYYPPIKEEKVPRAK